uniref:Transmembrane protein 68 n=1 Tax=Junco hyemalis TaxID=40217 RepID=A0A8C5JAM7_JUNHY
MIGRKESCASGQLPMTSLSCLFYALEEWTIVELLKKYIFHLIIASLTISAILVFFIVPLTIVFFIYLTNILLLIYQRNNELKADPLSDVWNGVRKTIAGFWDIYARIWHGYELHGVENIPQGPGLVVFYHGATPVDYIYFTARLHIMNKRHCSVVADHFVFRVPGFRILLDVFGVIHGPKEACVRTLEQGHLLAIAPGGLREALFSDETYNILWSDRKGFAQVAIDAKVPIIPMFTQNVREGFRTLGGIKILRSLYERIRLPIVPLYGGFPVKLRTFIGEPIPYEPNMTAEELATKTKAAVQALIDKHQKIPGNIFRALMERFQTQKKED